jgi:O-antigen/teichoic acid export membrane protein
LSSETGSRIAKNSIFNVVRTFLSVPITLLLTPFIIKHLGKQEFGIWALVGVISSYAQLSDFGITESLIKFMAEYEARKDSRRLNQLINTSFVVYLVLSVLCCSLFIMVLPFITDRILSIPPQLQAKANYVFTIAIILFFANMVMGVFGSLIIGFQRMGYSSLIGLVATVIAACGTLVFISQGYGLAGLIYNNAIVTVFVMASNIFAAKRLFPHMCFSPFSYFSSDILSKMFSFSWKVQVTNITQLMVYQLDRVLLSHFAGLEAVSYYEVANRIATQARGFITSIFSPMVPAASALQAVAGGDKIAGLYRRSFKYMAIAAVPFMTLLIALAPPFVMTWMGPGYETSAITMQLLLAAYMIVLFTAPGSYILSGINKPQINMRSSLLAGVANLILCLSLVQLVGYYGVVIGIIGSIVISAVYFVWMVQKNIPGLHWKMYPQNMLRPIVVAAGLAAAVLLLDSIHPLRGYLTLCVVSLLFMAAVRFAFYLGSYLDDFDRATLAKLNPLRVFTP